MTIKNGLIAGGFAILSTLAAAGWMRQPTASTSPLVVTPVSSAFVSPNTAQQQPVVTSPAYNTAPNGTVYAANQVSAPAPGCGEALPATPANYQMADYQPDRPVVTQRYSRRPVYVNRRTVSQPTYYSTRYETVRRSRSGKKSVALVAGSAGVGAAIGALAGGGKGAAIGALTGGGAGFLYDRLTHKTHSGF